MRIGLIDVDGTSFPNLALMKIAAYHRRLGHEIEWVEPLYWDYDLVYQSKVFTFTPDIDRPFPCPVIKGGTGYDIRSSLPEEIDRLQPDYSIYPGIGRHTAYGFLTRGCIRHCPWCVVPDKEGLIRPYMDVTDIAVGNRRRLILMDNNLLAAGDYALEQLDRIRYHGYRIDLNQGNDARLVTDDIARLMADIRWINYIRFACDTRAQIEECERAIDLLRRHGYSGRIFLYCILRDDFHESFSRISYWHSKGDFTIYPYAQPYRDPTTSDSDIPQWQRDLAHWTNRFPLYKSCRFEDFSPRQGFTCNEYFN